MSHFDEGNPPSGNTTVHREKMFSADVPVPLDFSKLGRFPKAQHVRVRQQQQGNTSAEPYPTPRASVYKPLESARAFSILEQSTNPSEPSTGVDLPNPAQTELQPPLLEPIPEVSEPPSSPQNQARDTNDEDVACNFDRQVHSASPASLALQTMSGKIGSSSSTSTTVQMKKSSSSGVNTGSPIIENPIQPAKRKAQASEFDSSTSRLDSPTDCLADVPPDREGRSASPAKRRSRILPARLSGSLGLSGLPSSSHEHIVNAEPSRKSMLVASKLSTLHFEGQQSSSAHKAQITDEISSHALSDNVLTPSKHLESVVDGQVNHTGHVASPGQAFPSGSVPNTNHPTYKPGLPKPGILAKPSSLTNLVTSSDTLTQLARYNPIEVKQSTLSVPSIFSPLQREESPVRDDPILSRSIGSDPSKSIESSKNTDFPKSTNSDDLLTGLVIAVNQLLTRNDYGTDYLTSSILPHRGLYSFMLLIPRSQISRPN